MINSSHNTTSLTPPVRPASSALRGKEWMLLTILRCLCRRWKQVAGFGMLASAAVGCAIWFLLPPPTPTAAAKLYIPKKPLTTLGGEHPDPPIDRETQLELVKSRLVLAAAIRPSEINGLTALQSQDDPLDWLVKNLRVEFIGPEIMRISLSYQDPEQARLLVDAIKGSFLQHIINRYSTARNERSTRLAGMATDQEEILKRKRNVISSLAKGSGGYDTERLAFQQRLLQDQMQAVRTQLIRIESDLRTGRIREGILSTETDSVIPDSILERNTDSDARVVESMQKLKLAEELHRQLIDKLTNPKSKIALEDEEKVKEQKKSHEALRTQVQSELRSLIVSHSKVERASQLQLQKQDNSILDTQVKQLRSELEQYGKSLSNERLQVEELEPIRFEIKQTEELLTRIRLAAANLMIENFAQARVIELEEAVIIPVNAARRRFLLSVGGSLTAFLLVAVITVLLEMRHRRVEAPTDLTSSLGLRIVGTVPKLANSRKGIQDSEDCNRQRAEAIACTRTMLLHSYGVSSHKIVMVASPVSGEGKTTLSVQLAVSIAQGGMQTLVVDGDLRNPSMGAHFQRTTNPGICEVLRGEASLFDSIQSTSIPGLMYIPAGNWTADTPEFMISSRLEQLFQILRDQFEFVILDSSPVLPVADALILARHTDGVILSVLQGVSRMPQVTEAAERFSMLGVDILGVVLNGTPAQSYGYGRSYYKMNSSPAPVVKL